MRRLILSLSFITTLLPFAGKAQEAIPLSLRDAMDYAVKYNYTAKNSRLDVLIQQARNAEITGLAYPQINGDAKFTQFTDPQFSFFPTSFAESFGMNSWDLRRGSFQPLGFAPNYMTSANITGSQLLFDGSVAVALQARKAVMALSEQSAQFTEEDTRYNVHRAYYGFVIAQKQFYILKASLRNARQILSDMQAMRNAGFAEKIEVDRVMVQVNNLATDSLRTSSLMDVSEQLLKFRMGMSINQPIVLTDTMVEEKLPSLQTLLNEDVSYVNRTDYKMALSQLSLNRYDLKRHRMSGLPTLALFASAGYNYSADEFSDLTHTEKTYVFSSLWGVQLNVPIFTGLQRTNRVKQAELNVQKSLNNIENLKLGIDFEAAQARTTLRNSLLALESQRRNMELGASVLDLANRKYKEGVGSNIEVTQAQSELLNAQNNYFLALLQVVNSESDLQRALGEFKN